ncbi:hypothetical protein ACP3TB_17755 [Rahnella variigena]|uniref:hypothetical protein n=1 Tax=Rahnella variigena TaxID=574964 RepID=UPI003CED23C3
MHLEVYTLFIFELFILILLTAVMLFAWIGGRRDPTLGLTALMLAFSTAGTLLSSMRSGVSEIIPVVFSNMMILLCYGMMWAALRMFTGRRVLLPVVFSGPYLAPALSVPGLLPQSGAEDFPDLIVNGGLYPADDTGALACAQATACDLLARAAAEFFPRLFLSGASFL